MFLFQIEAEWFPYQLSRILRGLYSQHDIETVYSLSKMKKRNHERNEGRLMMSVKITGLFEFKKKKEKQRRRGRKREGSAMQIVGLYQRLNESV